MPYGTKWVDGEDCCDGYEDDYSQEDEYDVDDLIDYDEYDEYEYSVPQQTGLMILLGNIKTRWWTLFHWLRYRIDKNYRDYYNDTQF